MPSSRGRRPSPALIVACLALAASLGGTGLAAVTAALPRNSVGPAQLQNNAVTSAKVKNLTLTRADFVPGTLTPGPQGAQGPPGASGPQGVKGDKGDKGASGAIGDVVEHSVAVDVPGGVKGDGTFDSRSIQANCASDEKGLTGGTNWDGEGDTTELITVVTTPVYDSGSKKITGWRGRGGNDSGVAKSFQVVVECVKV